MIGIKHICFVGKGWNLMLWMLLATSSVAFGQEQWEKENAGAITDIEIEMVKERQLKLPRASRNFDKVPPRPFEPIVPAIVYEFKNFSFTTPDYAPRVRPLRLKDEELSRMYGNSLTAAFGNFTSFLVAGNISTKRNKNKLLGADFYWRSFGKGPVEDNHSANSATRLKLFGKYIGKTTTVAGDVSYQNDRGYFYGYTPATEFDRDKIRQHYERIGLEGSIENTKRADFNYRFTGGYNYLKDAYVSSESEASVGFSGDYEIKKGSSMLFTSDIFLINRNESTFSDSRTLFRLKPAYRFKLKDNLELTIGVNMAIRNDAPSGAGNVNVYPHAKALYSFSDHAHAFVSLTGDMDKVNLHTLSAENLWLNSNNTLIHTNRSLDFQGGMEGKLGPKFTAKGGVSFATLKNLYFYQNQRNDLDLAGNTIGVIFDKFNVVYDKSTQRFNPFGEIAFAHTDAMAITFRADYFKYSTDAIADAWHRPTYRLDAQFRYNIYSKIVLQAGFIGQGGMKALDPGTGLAVNLEAAMDVNFKVRYFFSKQVSAFVHLDNLLSNQYPLYLRYPTRGFQGLVGASWSF